MPSELPIADDSGDEESVPRGGVGAEQGNAMVEVGLTRDEDTENVSSSLLMDSSPSFFKNVLTDLPLRVYHGVFEVVFLMVLIALISTARNGGAWMSGTNENLAQISAGLYTAIVMETKNELPLRQEMNLAKECANEARDSVACALVGAGNAAGGFVWLSQAFTFLLLVSVVLKEMQSHGQLESVIAKVPPEYEKYVPYIQYAPAFLWLVVCVTEYSALLLYATHVPPTFGAGPAYTCFHFGLYRFTFILTAAGALLHMAFVHGIGEDLAMELLENVRRAIFTPIDAKQRALQGILLGALACETLLWIRRPSWGILLIVYGLCAQHMSGAARLRHITLFVAAAILSLCTDALEVAGAGYQQSFYVTASLWLLMLCKLAAVCLSCFLRMVTFV